MALVGQIKTFPVRFHELEPKELITINKLSRRKKTTQLRLPGEYEFDMLINLE